MKLAMPVAEGQVARRLDAAEHFDIVEVDLVERKPLSAERADPGPQSPAELAGWLASQGVDLVIAGDVGAEYRQQLDERGVRVISTAPGDPPRELVKRFLSDQL